VGCGVILETGGGKVLGVRGDPDHPSNRGKLCSKGLNLHRTIHKKDRLTHPLMRDSRFSPFTSTTWDKALDRIAGKFRDLISNHGPESIAFYISGQLLTEDYYVVNKLSKGFLKVNNLDSNSRLCMSSAVMGYRRAFGVDAPPCSYEDIKHTDCVFIIGSNMAYCHPVVFMQLAEEKEKKGSDLKIIVADPRKTPTAGIADIFIPLKPGTDVALLNSMIHVLVENDLVDHGYITAHTEGFENFRDAVKEYAPEKVSEICGVPSSLITEAALAFGKAKAAMSFWAMGLNQSSSGTDKNNALLNLSIVTGNIGKPGAGPFSLTGQANAMGGRETGGLANLLPGHRYMADEEHRKEIDEKWGAGGLSSAKGLTAVEIYDGINSGRIKAVWIICTNPVVSLPNGSKVEDALAKAELVVVQDIFHPTDTTIFGDILLPAAGFGEKEGTMTSQERRISHISKAVDPPGEALPDWRIFTKFAHKMSFGAHFGYERAEDVFEEYKQLSRGRDVDITGVTYERLINTGPLQWPCPDTQHPGTPRLYTDGIFHTDTDKAKILTVHYNPQKEITDPEYPLVFTTGRVRDQWHTMTKTGKVESLTKSEPEPVLEINPTDAKTYGVREGDLTLVESRRGKATVRCKVTDKVREGTVFLPFHWGKLLANNGRANLLTLEAIDPYSQQPEFKACAVRVKKKSFDDESRVLILGNDPAALDLAHKINEINPAIDITLLATVENALNGRIRIDRRLPINVRTGEKTVELADGEALPYDKLVFAPGKKTYLLPVKGFSSEGIRPIRDFEDAKKIVARELVLGRAVVIGSRPSAIETADLLKSRGAEEVYLINPDNMLLDRYVDSAGSQFIHHKLTRRGINIILGAEIEEIIEKDGIKKVVLGRGREIGADLIFIESIMRPDLDLPLRTGLLINKGIVAGEQLETNIPDVYAVGKTAEVKGVLTHDPDLLTLQADVLARHISGDPTARYTESVDANRFHILGLEIISFGQFNADDEKSNVLTFLDKGQSIYKKIVVRGNRVVGGFYLGDTGGAEEVLALARSTSDISKYRDTLLSGNFREKLPSGRVVCSCMCVTEDEIALAIKTGNATVEALKERLKVAVTCGTCLEEVKEILRAAKPAH
jgi:ferredoxin-nitrate reductase